MRSLRVKGPLCLITNTYLYIMFQSVLHLLTSKNCNTLLREASNRNHYNHRLLLCYHEWGKAQLSVYSYVGEQTQINGPLSTD